MVKMNNYIKLNKKQMPEVFNGFKHVINAVSDDDQKPVLQKVAIECDRACATNGYTLNIYNFDEGLKERFPDGHYTVERNTTSDILLLEVKTEQYPNIDQVIPGLKDYDTLKTVYMSVEALITKEFTISKDKYNLVEASALLYRLAEQAESMVNIEIIKQAIQFNRNRTMVYYRGNGYAIYFESNCGTLKSVMMPLKTYQLKAQ